MASYLAVEFASARMLIAPLVIFAAAAYASGFSHTLFIAIGILAVAFIVSVIFARLMRNRRIKPAK